LPIDARRFSLPCVKSGKLRWLIARVGVCDLALAKLRAVEHRRFLVRATNSGVSAVVDPVGREVARSGLLTRENLRATVRLLVEPTPYTRYGDWVGWLSAGIVLFAVAGGLLRSPARHEASQRTFGDAQRTVH
jgi:apolipoprotein N-acyltransferase